MNTRSAPIMRVAAVLCLLLSLASHALAQDHIEVTGNVYCRSPNNAAERPFGHVRVFLKQRPDIVAVSGVGNGKFRLLLPATEIVDREIVIVYANAMVPLAEDARHIVRDDLVGRAGKTALQLPPRIFEVESCAEVDTAALRETVRLAIERISHRAAVIHGELLRAHAAGYRETQVCLTEALNRVGAHLRFAESRVPYFTDALGDDPVRAQREATAIKIADERVSELVESADHCVERMVYPATAHSMRYAPDTEVTPSEVTSSPAGGEGHPMPWGTRRPGDGVPPEDDDWHLYAGTAFETGYDSNFLQKNQDREGGSSPAAWQFRPSLHLALRRWDPTTANLTGSTMQSGPVQSAKLSLVGMLLTSVQGGGRGLGVYSDVGVVGDFQSRFGDKSPLGGLIFANYRRTVEPSIEPENAYSFGTNDIGLGADAMLRPGLGQFEVAAGYRLGLVYNDSAYLRHFNRVRHAAVVRERWLFLPETALVHDTELSSLSYIGYQLALNDSTQVRSRMGLVGLITARTSIEAMFGIAEGYYGTEHGRTRNFSGPIGHGKLEWFLGPVASSAYPERALVRPSVSLTYDHDFHDNLSSDYYRYDRGIGELTLAVDGRWLIVLHAGVGKYNYSVPRFYNPFDASVSVFRRFHETRIDLGGALEYRVLPQLRFTVSLRYDRNLSDSNYPIDLTNPWVVEPLAFQRSRLYGGIIWAM